MLLETWKLQSGIFIVGNTGTATFVIQYFVKHWTVKKNKTEPKKMSAHEVIIINTCWQCKTDYGSINCSRWDVTIGTTFMLSVGANLKKINQNCKQFVNHNCKQFSTNMVILQKSRYWEKNTNKIKMHLYQNKDWHSHTLWGLLCAHKGYQKWAEIKEKHLCSEP